MPIEAAGRAGSPFQSQPPCCGKGTEMSDPRKQLPWRKRWPGKLCFKLQVQTEMGSLLEIEGPLTSDEYDQLLAILETQGAGDAETD